MNKILEDHIASIPDILRAFYNSSSSYKSPAELGKLREKFISDVLRFHLPSIFEVTSGEIIDSVGAVSRQQDIIIYRRDFPKFSISPNSSHVFIEGVNSTFEVKSKLDYIGFRQALDNIKTVKELSSRIQPLAVGAKAGYVFSYIFSYDGPAMPTVLKYFSRYMNENNLDKIPFFELLPDAIYILDKDLYYKNDGFIWKKCGNEIIVTSDPLVAFSKFLFYILISSTRGDIYAIDWSHYLI